MTTATETKTEFTQAQIAHRNACAFLKGILCGYAEYRGHTYQTAKNRTPEFDKGFELGMNRLNCGDYIFQEDITDIHIIHNRLRHDRPHISEDYDAAHTAWKAKKLIEKHLGEGTFDLAMEQAQLEREARNG